MTSTAGARSIIVASNRGPVSFAEDERGQLVPRRGKGGLVTAIGAALQSSGGLWIASAMSDADHRHAGRTIHVDADRESYRFRMLPFDPQEYGRFYDGISNRVLWFLHHHLWDLPRRPTFEGLALDWAAYRAVNEEFARALDEEGPPSGPPPVFLVQDYHLALVPAILRGRRPDAPIAHFSHIPFAGPNEFRILPQSIREELLGGLLGADVVGFQAPRWAENFLLCCRTLPGARVDLWRSLVRWQGRRVRVRIYPVSIDPAALTEDASTEPVARARDEIARMKGDRRLLLRVDRAELSKNILRGLLAYERFLLDHQEWAGRVSFLALLNPSRQHLPEYRAYAQECVALAERINGDLGRPGWKPIELSLQDDYARALAAYQLYDVLVVNPVYDGMNLVAKEGPVLNGQDGALVLSENAGAFAELGPWAVPVNPFDVEASAEAILAALTMDPAERGRRARELRKAVSRNRIDRWVAAQLRDLDRVRPSEDS